MLNINPMNSYSKSNISFKSQKDYSKIYKEMEKITLAQEEKVIPKFNLKKQVEKKLTTSSILNKKNNYLSKISWVIGKTPLDKLQRALCVAFVFPIAYAVSMLFLLSHIFSDNKEQSSGNWVTEYVDKVQKIVTGNKNDTEQSFESNNLAKEAFFKADSLENLYKDSTISFNDYKKQMQNLINEYKIKTLHNFLEKNGIALDKEGLGDEENTYFEDENGVTVIRTDDLALDEKLKEKATEINKNVEILKQKLQDNEEIENKSKEKNDSILSKIEDEKDTLKIESKEDSLFNLYKTKEITLEEFQNELNKINER